MAAVEFRHDLHATLVGQATGEMLNGYGEVKELTLPHSGLKMQYSTKYFRLGKNDVGPGTGRAGDHQPGGRAGRERPGVGRRAPALRLYGARIDRSVDAARTSAYATRLRFTIIVPHYAF